MKIITPQDILQATFAAGVESDYQAMGDPLYVVPMLEWLKNSFWLDLKTVLDFVKTSVYDINDNDCDKFAGAAHFMANACNHATPGHPQAGLALGEFWYQKDGGAGGHAINIAIVDSDLKVVFFEPQNQTIVELSATEKQSCTLLKF